MKFDKHELVITKNDNVELYELLIKGTDGKYTHRDSVCFSYVNSTLERTLHCFGDYGNFTFGKPINFESNMFIGYFCEKLRYKTIQDLKGPFDDDVLKEDINQRRAILMDERPDDLETLKILDEIATLDNEFDLNHYLYNEINAYNVFETNTPSGRDINYDVTVIFEAFLEISRRLEKDGKTV